MVTDSQQIRRTAEATHSDMLVSFIFLSSPYRGGLFVIRFSILHTRKLVCFSDRCDF